MDWYGLIVNVAAVFAGLFIYIGITRTKWGKKFTDYPYAIMLVSVLAACLIGFLLRLVLDRFLPA